MSTAQGTSTPRPFVLVVAVEESAPGLEALRLATELAAQWRVPPEVHLVHVVHRGADEGSAELDRARAWLIRESQDIRSAIHGQVVPHLLRGDTTEQIHGLARLLGAKLLVVGSHGRTGVRHFVLGSVAERIARTAPCPVLVARPDAALLHSLPDESAAGIVPTMTTTVGGAVAGAALGAFAGPIGMAAGAALGAGAGGALGYAAGEERREADHRDNLLDEILLAPPS